MTADEDNDRRQGQFHRRNESTSLFWRYPLGRTVGLWSASMPGAGPLVASPARPGPPQAVREAPPEARRSPSRQPSLPLIAPQPVPDTPQPAFMPRSTGTPPPSWPALAPLGGFQSPSAAPVAHQSGPTGLHHGLTTTTPTWFRPPPAHRHRPGDRRPAGGHHQPTPTPKRPGSRATRQGPRPPTPAPHARARGERLAPVGDTATPVVMNGGLAQDPGCEF